MPHHADELLASWSPTNVELLELARSRRWRSHLRLARQWDSWIS
jgi:hypothetical protein